MTIVKSLWITRKSEPEASPELLEAWDEYSLDANWEGWEEACEKALAAVGSDVDHVRYIDLHVPTRQVNAAFATIEIEVDTVG